MNLKKHTARQLITSVFILIYAASLSGCSEQITGNLPAAEPEITQETTITEETTPEETTPAVTEPPSVQRSDIQSVRQRPEEPVSDDILSVLSEYEKCYSVIDGYYQINFLEDKLFEEEINKDIHNAMDSLRNFHNEDYSEQAVRSHSSEIIATNGISADIIVRNGFLSILLEYGYTKPFSSVQAGSYTTLFGNDETIYFDHAVTLNYELSSKNRITDFAELFYNDSDWENTVRNAESYEYRGNSIPFFPEEKPELFTIDYIIFENDYGMSTARYNSPNLNLSLCQDMISAFYRNMSDICIDSHNEDYPDYSESYQRSCELCGAFYEYHSISLSRFYSDERINELNADLDQLYEHGFPGKAFHDCEQLRSSPTLAYNSAPDKCMKKNHIFLWESCSKDNELTYYDPYTFDKLNASAILGSDWRSYASGDNLPDLSYEEPEIFFSLKYNISEGKVNASVLLSDNSTLCSIDIPADLINQNYIN